MSVAEGPRVPNFRVSGGSPEGDAFSLNGEGRFWMLMAEEAGTSPSGGKAQGCGLGGGLGTEV